MVKTIDMYKGVIAFICLQLVALGIVGLYPQLVNYLPNRSSLLSETAPPPKNPRCNTAWKGSCMRISSRTAMAFWRRSVEGGSHGHELPAGGSARRLGRRL
jgi:hypothetical protein